MGIDLKGLHKIEKELRAVKRQLAPLRRRYQRAGRFTTRDRIQAQIDALVEEVKAIEGRLIASWTE